MKISIYYYSGACNTQYIAHKFNNKLKEKLHNTTCEKITEESIKEVDDNFDMLGIGFPVYFRDAPALVYDLLHKINGLNRPVFFFATKGLYSGNAMKKLFMHSMSCNFLPVGTIEFFMPGTDFLILFSKQGSLFEHFLKFIHSRNIDKKISKYINSILDLKTKNVPYDKWYSILDDYLIKPLETMYDNQHKSYIGKFYANSETCTKCMKCVKGCPRNNIVAEEKVNFGEHCDVCFYCIHNCPEHSIQLGEFTIGKTRYNKVELL